MIQNVARRAERIPYLAPMLNLLYVDDDPDIREIAALALAIDPDITVETAPSGQKAIERIDRGGIDVLLLDVMMPDLDGPATLAQIKSKRDQSALQVVFATARTEQRDIEHYRTLGATGVVQKPFDPMTLAQEVRLLAQRAA